MASGTPARSSAAAGSVSASAMEEFYRDLLRFGCLRGFKHFVLYLRGREELLVTVRRPPSGEGVPYLVGAYARYNFPYVWLRTAGTGGAAAGVAENTGVAGDPNSPLELACTKVRAERERGSESECASLSWRGPRRAGGRGKKDSLP